MRIFINVLCALVYLLGVGVVDVAGLEDMSDMSVGLGEGFSIRVVGLEVVGKRGVPCLVDMGGVYATLYLSAVFKWHLTLIFFSFLHFTIYISEMSSQDYDSDDFCVTMDLFDSIGENLSKNLFDAIGENLSKNLSIFVDLTPFKTLMQWSDKNLPKKTTFKELSPPPMSRRECREAERQTRARAEEAEADIRSAIENAAKQVDLEVKYIITE